MDEFRAILTEAATTRIEAPMYNDDKDPEAPPPGPHDVERITYDAACTCDDTYGDNPWCPACYPKANQTPAVPMRDLTP